MNNNTENILTGKTFVLGSHWLSDYYDTPGMYFVTDKMLSQYHKVTQTYNCYIDFRETVEGSSQEVIAEIIASGYKPISFYNINSWEAFYLYKANMLISYDDTEYIDFTTNKWGPLCYRAPTIYVGKNYGVYPYLWDNPIPNVTAVMIYNPNYLSRLSIPSPYELLENNQWTWDIFLTILQNCTYKENYNCFGLGAQDRTALAKGFIYSNGGSYVADNNGKLNPALSEKQAVDALIWAQSLCNTDVFYKNDDIINMFNNQRIAFLACNSNTGTVESGKLILSINERDWMVFPYGPMGEYGSRNAVVDYLNRTFVMPISVVNKDEVAFFMDKLFSPINDSAPEGWKNKQLGFTFLTDKSKNLYISLIENAKYDYSAHMNLNTANLINMIINNLLSNSEICVSDEIENIRNIIQSELDANFNCK